MEHKTINEGNVTIEVPYFHKVSAKAPVFYNPVMELNRDLSVAAIQVFQMDREEDITICDAFGGTGIRGIRYASEIGGVGHVVITDLNPLAVQFTEDNVHKNNLNNIDVYREDANLLLRKCRGKFDVVDVDPFGTPSPYIESSAFNLRSGGMLCVTATDTSALCGTYKEPCIRKYGAVSLKTEYCHETGLRILVGFISRTFAKYKKYVDLKFSHSTEHYLRLYLTIGKGAKKTDESLNNLGYIAHCNNCLYRMAVPGLAPSIPGICPVCKGNFRVGGPLWLGKLLEPDFIENMINIMPDLNLKMENEALKLLERCYEESNAPITFFDLHVVSKNLKISSPPLHNVLEKLKANGFFASRTHFKPTGIKTNAPVDALKKIVLSLK